MGGAECLGGPRASFYGGFLVLRMRGKVVWGGGRGRFACPVFLFRGNYIQFGGVDALYVAQATMSSTATC